MASNLKVSEIEGLSSNPVSCPHGLTSAESITANGGISLGGDITGQNKVGEGTGDNRVTEVNASGTITGGAVTTAGAVTGGSLNTAGVTTSSGLITASGGIQVGTNAPSGHSVVIDDTLTVKSTAAPGASADALTVDQGNVKMGSSAVTIGSLIIGGTTYTSSDFSDFGSGSGGSGTNYVKAFGQATYDFDGSTGAIAYEGSYNVNQVTQDVSAFTVTITFSSTISNPIPTFSSSQDGEDGDSGKQLTWYVSSVATGSITLTLRNAEATDTGTLYFTVVDA